MLLKAMLNSQLAAREMDRLFDSMFSGQAVEGSPARSRLIAPAVNVTEDADAYHAEAELPGVLAEHLEIDATVDQVTIRGSRVIEAPEGARVLRRERAAGTFERTIGLPAPIDADRVEARLSDGVLTITLPKRAEDRPRRVEVRSLPQSS